MDKRKKELRKHIRNQLRSISPEKLADDSKRIASRLELLLTEMAARSANALNVAMYAPMAGEINLMPLLEKFPCIKWFFPQCGENGEMIFKHVTNPLRQLVPGFKGIPEPGIDCPIIEPEQLDVIITPGLAFSPQGHRLGKGGGFYDRYLAKTGHCLLIGVAAEEQLVEEIPCSVHDLKVHQVICPGKGYTCLLDNCMAS